MFKPLKPKREAAKRAIAANRGHSLREACKTGEEGVSRKTRNPCPGRLQNPGRGGRAPSEARPAPPDLHGPKPGRRGRVTGKAAGQWRPRASPFSPSAGLKRLLSRGGFHRESAFPLGRLREKRRLLGEGQDCRKIF
jgi:hypothetical protein